MRLDERASLNKYLAKRGAGFYGVRSTSGATEGPRE